MARKHLLDGLMGAPKATEAKASEKPALDPERPRFSKGAIGAISRSVADLQARALMDIDPNLIEAGGLEDRLETDPAQDDALRQSIAEYGQQVPVLVRPHPSKDGYYQIVYGRRRVLALRDLGLPVKALLRQLDDRDLILAQGQENTARRDLSFIEKANFARQMVAAGYDRKTIGDTLSMDKTLISRLLSVADRIPESIIQTIGAAPSVGRDRWLTLADALETYGDDVDDMIATINLNGENSDQRFETALKTATHKPAIKAPAPALDPTQVIQSLNGVPIAEISHKGGRLTLKFDKKLGTGFEDWITTTLPELHAKWSRGE